MPTFKNPRKILFVSLSFVRHDCAIFICGVCVCVLVWKSLRAASTALIIPTKIFQLDSFVYSTVVIVIHISSNISRVVSWCNLVVALHMYIRFLPSSTIPTKNHSVERKIGETEREREVERVFRARGTA